MNIAKHMEAVLVAAFALIAATGIATAAVPAASVTPLVTPTAAAAVAATPSAPMQVVVIVGKRQPRT